MIRQFRLICSFALTACLWSCGSTSDSKPNNRPTAEPQKSDGTVDKYSKGWQMGKDEQGNPKIISDRRSSFERSDYHLNRDSSLGKQFQTSNYATNQWGNKSDYSTKSYAGVKAAKGYDQSPYFLKRQSELAKNSGFNQKSYNTQNFSGVKSSQEQGSQFKTSSNSYTETRRNNTAAPPVVNWKNQRDLTVDDTKKMLGN